MQRFQNRSRGYMMRRGIDDDALLRRTPFSIGQWRIGLVDQGTVSDMRVEVIVLHRERYRRGMLSQDRLDGERG